MRELKLVIEFCIRILSIDLNVEGYHFSLANVIIYGLVGFINLYILFRIFR